MDLSLLAAARASVVYVYERRSEDRMNNLNVGATQSMLLPVRNILRRSTISE